MNVWNIRANETRESGDGVARLFVERWSPRAMTGEPLTREQLLPLFEAARWAPSANNSQPWRFVYASNGDEHWHALFDLLSPGNQAWCKNAGALVIVLSRNWSETRDRPLRTHSFDTGSAWMSLALQARLSGIVAHGMGGFDRDRARDLLGLSEHFSVEAMVALGHPGEIDDLPDSHRDRETPSSRRPIDEILFHGALS